MSSLRVVDDLIAQGPVTSVAVLRWVCRLWLWIWIVDDAPVVMCDVYGVWWGEAWRALYLARLLRRNRVFELHVL